MMNTAVSGQNLLWLIPSINRPSARSFSATIAAGVGQPMVEPCV